MEALLAAASNNGAEETLIGNLRYGLDPQGSYITQRRQSTTFSNVNVASPDSVQAITINVGSAVEWLDTSSILLSFLIKNDDTGKNCSLPVLIPRSFSTGYRSECHPHSWKISRVLIS